MILEKNYSIFWPSDRLLRTKSHADSYAPPNKVFNNASFKWSTADVFADSKQTADLCSSWN